MGKKEKQFEQSKEWLDWLDDNKAEPSEKPVGQGSNHAQVSAQRAAAYQALPAYRAAAGHSARPIIHDAIKQRHASQVSSTNVTEAPRAQVPSHDDEDLVINLHLPRIRLPRIHVPKRRVLIAGTIGLVVLFLVVGTPYLVRYMAQKKSVTSQSTSSAQPTYVPLEPQTNGSTAKSVSGEQYVKDKQLYQYADTYKGVSLTVSQQPLPEALRSDPTKLKAAAAAVGANESVTTTNGVVYISTGDNLTSQRLMFASKQLLVFITANGVLKNADWVNYVQSLDSKI